MTDLLTAARRVVEEWDAVLLDHLALPATLQPLNRAVIELNRAAVPSGPHLAALRLSRGLRVGEVATAIGLTPSRVSQLERSDTVTQTQADRYEQAVDIAMANRATEAVTG